MNDDDGNSGCETGCGSITTGWSCTENAILLSSCWLNCGDGDLDDNEECDDGGVDDGNGCSSTCLFEDGWTCTGSVLPGLSCSENCGDSLKVGTETCDDGSQNGEGCNASCNGN